MKHRKINGTFQPSSYSRYGVMLYTRLRGASPSSCRFTRSSNNSWRDSVEPFCRSRGDAIVGRAANPANGVYSCCRTRYCRK